MRKFGKVVAAVLSLMLLVLCFAGCQSSGDGTDTSGSPAPSSSADAQGGTLVMATNAEFPPFEFMVEEGKGIVGQYDGIDVAIAQEIAQELGKTLEVSNMLFDSIIPSINSGKADMGVAGMTVSAERAANVDFSEPYWTAVQTILVQNTNTDITGVDSLQGKTVGVVTGYTGDLAMEEKGGSDLKRYNKGIDAVADLKNGKIDAVIIDSPTAESFLQKNPQLKGINDSYFETEEYAIAVKKGNTELLNQINEVIRKLKEEGRISQIAEEVDSRLAQ